MTIKTTVRGYLADAARAFDRAPVEVALALCAALAISYGIEANVGEAAVHFTIAALLIGAVAWSATLLHASGALSIRQRWLVTFVGVLAGAAYLLLVPDLDKEAEAWRALMLLVAAFLMMFAVPAWRTADDTNLRLRRVNGRFLLRAIGIGLYGLALFAGLALALVSIDNLFELKLEGKIYLHVLTWIMLVLVPWVIVGGLDYYVAPLDQQSDVERAVHRLTRFLVPPLVAIYYLILIAYTIRIAITGELPQNLVSPMVIAAGLLAGIALILFDPAVDTHAGMRWLRFMPVLFILLAPLGVWALYARIDAYGWTEFRLLRLIVLVALLVLAILAVVQLVKQQRYTLRFVPIVIAVTLFIAALGPWSVLRVARHDQQQRLLGALRRARIDAQAAPPRADTTRRAIPQRLYAQINSTSTYLVSHFGAQALPTKVLQTAWQTRPYALAEFYYLTSARADTAGQTFSGSMARGVPVARPDGRMALRVEYATRRARELGTRTAQDTLLISVGGQTLYAPLGSMLTGLRSRAAPDRRLQTPQSTVTVVDPRGAIRGELVVLDVTFTEKKQRIEITYLNGVLLLDK